ncbi:hypothetical protein [Parafrankia discariae]|nr:hypothetical protein [Parafrankia discariae]
MVAGVLLAAATKTLVPDFRYLFGRPAEIEVARSCSHLDTLG